MAAALKVSAAPRTTDFPACFEIVCQFADGGGFPNPIHTNYHNHIWARLCRKVEIRYIR